jgi:hypothetical protein
MPEVQRCEGQFPEGCGQVLQETPVQLSGALVRILEVLVARYPRSMTSQEVGDVLGKTAYTRVSKLRHFGLAEQGGPAPNQNVVGWWRATQWGVWFMAREHEVVQKVWVFRNKVTRVEGEPQGIEAVKRYVPVNRETVLEQWQPVDPDEIDPDGA